MTTRPPVFVTALLVSLALGACGDEAAGPGPVFDNAGPLYHGFGLVPWHVTWSPDGRWLVVAESATPERGILRVFDAALRRCVHEVRGLPWPAVLPPCFSQDGTGFALRQDRDLVLYRRTGSLWAEAKRLPLGIKPVALRPRPLEMVWQDDRKRILVPVDEGLLAVDVETGETRLALRVADPRWLRPFPDGRIAVSTVRGKRVQTTLYSRDLDPLRVIEDRTLLAVSPDGGRWLMRIGPPWGEDASGSSPRLEVWREPGGERIAAFGLSFLQDPTEVAGEPWVQGRFTGDGRHLVLVEDWRRIAIRDAVTGELLQVIREYEGNRLVDFDVSPDGTAFVTGGLQHLGNPGEASGVILWRRRGG